MDSSGQARPWSVSYSAGLPHDITPEHQTPLTMLAENVRRWSDRPALRYFDGSMTWSQVDRAADALAALLRARAFKPGDRLALVLQNNPAFVIGLFATWKAGGVAVPLSPMSKERELDELLRDSDPVALVALDDLYEDVVRHVLASGAHRVHTVVTVSALDGQARSDARLFGETRKRMPGDSLDLEAIIASASTATTDPARPGPSDLAVVAYTSGTTGTPKGALITHGNLAFTAQAYRDWTGLGERDVVLALAPVFHISGLVGGVMLSTILGAPLLLTHRFEASVMLDVIREQRPTFALAAITAYLGLADDGGGEAEDFASFRWLCSGGAPIEPDVVDRLESTFGHYIHNVYGQTETTSPSHAVPMGMRAPVDQVTGSLSIGLPVFNTTSRVLGDDGAPLPPGEIGELVTSGPQVVRGYWNDPVATSESFAGEEFRTGDVGFMGPDGWFYVLDRRRDVINASGFKIWPREVEQVLQTHPGVREVAVVGIPDEYRGQSVKAFVALESPSTVTEVDLIRFSRERLAAFKYPREIELVAELPRTVTGKISRRQLRHRG